MQFQPMAAIKAKDEEDRLRGLRPEEVDGMGPFMFNEGNFVRDSRISQDRNPDWHLGEGGTKPYLDGIDTVYIADYSTFVAATRTKSLLKKSAKLPVGPVRREPAPECSTL